MKTYKDMTRKNRLRRWGKEHTGGFEAAHLHPLDMIKFRPGEGGTLQQQIDLQLAPVNGYMRSAVTAEIVSVFVSYQACEKQAWGDEVNSTTYYADAGVTEMTRRRLLAGTALPLEVDRTVSDAAFIHPREVGQANKRVDSANRHAYNAAVNLLRRMAYPHADLLPPGYAQIAPAVLGRNSLQMFGGVLDPETNIDGAINLTGDLPVKGIAGRSGSANAGGDQSAYGPAVDANNDSVDLSSNQSALWGSASENQMFIERDPTTGQPLVLADLSGAGEVTLRDMIKSQKLDGIVRNLATIAQNDPRGEEQVARTLFNLQLETDDEPVILYRREITLTPEYVQPMDGASINDVQGHFRVREQFTTVVPRTELGGVVVNMVAVKPLEVIERQPDPHWTETWRVDNQLLDELELEEQLIVRRDLESDVADANGDVPAMWVGYNSLYHDYVTAGANTAQTHATEADSVMWTYAVPSSVTPDNISYPVGGVSMYPFANWNGHHVEYSYRCAAMISTPLARGPSPVERLQLFVDDPSLVTG